MRGIVKRRLYPVLMFVATLAASLVVLACAAALGGCGASVWSRAATVTAIAATEVEHGGAAGFLIASSEVRADLAADGNLTLETWCEAVAPAWNVASRIQCAAQAIADLARGADAVIAADETPGMEWAGAACAALRATCEVWETTGSDTPQPTALTAARDLLCGLSGPWQPEDPPCVVGPVPGCEVTP